ncbi:MAG TPA: amino acid permease [Vicinamibacterales bacterium]|nr:amino acid permease [Vicinamibacterales bacterium]
MSAKRAPSSPLRIGRPLERRLGVWSAFFIVVGITIGSGIFRTPAVIAARVPDPMLMLAVWVAGGLMALAGALSIAELAAALPHSGGPYVFLREAWGRPAAFLFGWTQFTLIRAASLGALAIVFSEYLLRSFGYDPGQHPLLTDAIAAGGLLFATIANVLGVRFGAGVVNASTAAKYFGLIVIVACALFLGGSHGASLSHFVEPADGRVEAGLFGLALISVLWAYDGFADVSFVSGEIVNPQRNLPRALILGTIAIVAIYALANAAYLYVIPVGQLAQSDLVAADTMGALFGQAGVSLVSALVMVSTFGSLNGTMLASPRVFFAMADDGLFFRRMAGVHPRYGTPHAAVLLAGGLGMLMVVTQTFERLADTFVLATWPFYALAVAGLYRLRRMRPDLPRPYRVTGYPVVPAVFIVGAVYLVVNALITDAFWTSLVFAIAAAGLPVYYIWFRR